MFTGSGFEGFRVWGSGSETQDSRASGVQGARCREELEIGTFKLNDETGTLGCINTFRPLHCASC